MKFRVGFDVMVDTDAWRDPRLPDLTEDDRAALLSTLRDYADSVVTETVRDALVSPTLLPAAS